MTTAFPAALDDFTNPTADTDTDTGDHAGMHADANDAIEALQAKVGIDNSNDQASLDYKVRQRLLASQLAAAMSNVLLEGSNVDITYDPETGKITIASTGGGGGGGSGDVVGPAGATADTLPLFSGTTGKIIKQGPAVPAGGLAGLDALATKADTTALTSGLAGKADTSALTSGLALKADLLSPALTGTPTSTTPSTADNSTRIATTAMVQAALSAAVAGLLDLKTATDASGNPNYPAALKGDTYLVSVAGRIGGASGKQVDVSDLYIAIADNAGGTEASVGTSWVVMEHNLVGAALVSAGLTQFAAITSAQLASLLTNETGTGLAVFNDGATLNAPTITGVSSVSGAQVTTPTAMGANVIDITKGSNTKTFTGAVGYTFSATPTVAGQEWGVLVTATTAGILTLPSFVSALTQGSARTTVYLPLGQWYLAFRYDGTNTYLHGEPGSVNNYAATAAPAVTDDNTKGYAAGSLWGDATGNTLYWCESAATGAAVWNVVGGGGGGDMVLASTQTVTGAKTFAAGTAKLAGSTSGSITLATPAAAGAGTVTFPLTGTLGTLAGVETLSNKVVQLDTLPATNNTGQGQAIAGANAGATLAQWDAVYMGSGGTWLLADANGSGTFPCRGLALVGAASGAATAVLDNGVARNDAWTWTPGAPVYLSTTAGGLTQTAPSASGDKVQQIGFALTADSIRVNIGSGEYLTVA